MLYIGVTHCIICRSPPLPSPLSCLQLEYHHPVLEGRVAKAPTLHEVILFPHRKPLFPQSIFYPLVLNADGRILKNGLSKLHYRFLRYSTLPKTVLLESRYLQIMTVFLIFIGQILEKIVITLQLLRFKQKCLRQRWISSKSIMQLTKTFPPNSAIFIEKKWVEKSIVWKKCEFLWGEGNVLSTLRCLSQGSLSVELPRDSQLGSYHHQQQAPIRSYSPPSPRTVPFLRCMGMSTRRERHRSSLGLSTGIPRAACQVDIQAQNLTEGHATCQCYIAFWPVLE